MRYGNPEQTIVVYDDGSTGTLEHFKEQRSSRLMIPYPTGYETEEESDAEYARLRREAIDVMVAEIEPYRKYANTEIAISDLKAKINLKASTLILERYPETKQLNLIHQHFVTSKKPGRKSDEDQELMDRATEMRNYIDDVVDTSNRLIADLEKYTPDELNTYDIEAQWPGTN